MFRCSYCTTEFTSKYSLTTHQKSAKYCLGLQGLPQSNSVTCEFCQRKYVTVYTLAEHHRTCPVKQQLEANARDTERMQEIKQQYEDMLTNARNKIMLMEQEIEAKRQYENMLAEAQHKILYMEQEMNLQQKHYEALLREKDIHYEHTKGHLEKSMSDITEIAKQVKSKTTHTNNIMIHSTSLDLNNTDHLHSILEQHLDINVIAEGQKGVAKMLKDHFLTDEKGQKKYRCTDANRGHFEFVDPHGNLERDPKGTKLREALVKSEIKEVAYSCGQGYWQRHDGSLDRERFDVMNGKVKEVADIGKDDTKLRTELSALLS